MNTTYKPASVKQIKMIKALCWQLRPYYLFHQWQSIRLSLLEILRNPSYQDCDKLIKRMLIAVQDKKDTQIVWVPMDYNLSNPEWQNNIMLLASWLFPDDKDLKSRPCALDAWRELKNRIERRELERSYEYVYDDFEYDTRYASLEAERWRHDKIPYQELIAGVDFLEPTPGIDD